MTNENALATMESFVLPTLSGDSVEQQIDDLNDFEGIMMTFPQHQRVLGRRLGVRYEHFARVQLAGRQNRIRQPRRRLCGLSVQSVRVGPERR